MMVDLAKAYDRIYWDFLETVLVDFNYLSMVIRLIMYCVSSTSIPVLWNGWAREPFAPSRGFRQGCSLCPYLFVLCMEKLGTTINQKVVEEEWKPIRLTRRVFLSEQQLDVMLSVIDDFCLASGESINKNKSSIVFSENVQGNKQFFQCQKRVVFP